MGDRHMRQAAKTQSVERIDPVWGRIREEAEQISRHEPAMGGFIFSLGCSARFSGGSMG